MAFTYDVSTDRGKVRLLVSDTDAGNYVWEDAEVDAVIAMQLASTLYVSAQLQALASQSQPGVSIGSLYRAAALLLDSLAANRARLSSVKKLLDVELSPVEAAKTLRETAKNYREIADESGEFAIAEMISDPFGARERMTKQIERLY